MVGYMCVRFSTMGKKTKIRAIDITFKPFEIKLMAIT